MIHPQKVKDLKMGEDGENDIYEMINKYLSINALKTGKYCPFDMVYIYLIILSITINVEL